jgi:hypothetical protein
MCADELSQMLDALMQRIVGPALSEGEVRTIATQLQSFSVKIAARELFHVLKAASPSEATANVLSLFRELMIREPAWKPLLERSLKKKGRCPAKLRPTLKQLLASDASQMAVAVSEFSDVLAAEVFADFDTVVEEKRFSARAGSHVRAHVVRSLFGRTRVTIPITTALTDIQRMEDLSRLLHEIKVPLDELTLDFADVEHTYVVGLSAIMAWCAEHDIRPQIENASERVDRYLDLVGFGRPAQTGIASISDNFYTMAIEPIQQAAPEAVADKLVRIIDRHMPISKQVRSGLLVTFAELVENIHRHAGIVKGAYACAQVYPKKRKLTICIVDTGMGIAESISTGENPALVKRLQSGESPVKLATLPLITSKPGRHSGYGLYVVSELAIRNGGTVRIFSGNEILTLYRKGWSRKEHRQLVSEGWNGTWIALLLDLESYLPIGDVYNTLPPAHGTELEEYF